MSSQRTLRLIAHRGLMERFPENTLRGLSEAVAAGARYVEFDIQCSADGIPHLFHDPTLERTTGLDGSLLDLEAEEIGALSAHEPARLGTRFRGEPVPTLEAAVALLNRTPQVTAFIELKRHSLSRHGIAPVVGRLRQTLEAARFPWIPISFEIEAVQAARRAGQPVGWVLRAYDEEHLDAARTLAPEFLFCKWERLPRAPARLAPGPWQWAIYDTCDAAKALELQALGADCIETACIDRLAAALQNADKA